MSLEKVDQTEDIKSQALKILYQIPQHLIRRISDRLNAELIKAVHEKPDSITADEILKTCIYITNEKDSPSVEKLVNIMAEKANTDCSLFANKSICA